MATLEQFSEYKNVGKGFPKEGQRSRCLAVENECVNFGYEIVVAKQVITMEGFSQMTCLDFILR